MNALRVIRNRSYVFLALLVMQACAESPAPSGDGYDDRQMATNDAGEPIEVASTSAALTAVPGCIDVVYDGRDYRWCSPFVPWITARDTCRSYGLELVSIQDAAENAFVAQLAGGLVPMWIGANDIATENTWTWSNGNVPFLTGSIPGTPVMGRYENFPDWEPVPDGGPGGALDCANIRPGTAGAWFTTSCLEFSTFVCETNDVCPGDPLKTTPGVCGCGVADTDGDADSVPNCIDLCPGDPGKTDPGIMGCGVADTDTDGDGVPNPIDQAPTDVNVQVIGTCGTAAAPAPAGTVCADAPCPGRFTCDGAGRCGTATSCPLPNNGGTCRYRRFQERSYWFCSTPQVWSAAASNCRNVGNPGMALVEISSSAENAFVARNLTADTWIGGNDISLEGTMRWAKPGASSVNDGQRFWTGGPTGKPSYARYTNWLSNEPSSSSSTEDCVMMSATGTNRGRWDVQNCDATGGRPFVCEAPGPELRITKLAWPVTPKLNEIYGLPDSPAVSWTDCVSENLPPLGPYNPAPVEIDSVEKRVMKELSDCSRNLGCVGAAAAPPLASDRCPAWTSEETTTCQIKTPRYNGSEFVRCTVDAECASQPVGFRRCGFYGVQILPTLKWDTDRVCGAPEDGCPDPAEPTSEWCKEIKICQIQNQQTLATFSAPGADLTPAPLVASAVFGAEPLDPAVTPYADQSNPCPTGFLGACDRNENHPWCNYDVNDSAIATTGKSVNGAGTGRTGDSNAAAEDLISFNFDPKMLLTYNAGIGALGLPSANLKAEAGLTAGIKLGSIVVDLPDFEVIDVLASVNGSQCGLTTGDSHIRLLEKDFVPGPWGNPELAGPLAANKTRCEDLYLQFQDAADRANKALRDAAYLIRQYRSLPAGGNFANLCMQIAATAPRGFPVSAGCATERPETTIARFVSYYRSTVLGFPASAGIKSVSQLAQEFAALSGPPNVGEFKGTIDIFNSDFEPEELTIGMAQFFIGPIPCNLEIYAALTYGIDVKVNWALNPGGLISSALFAPGVTNQTNVAELGITAGPYATALLGVFAGAGFDVGPVAAKFGVDAQLTLGTIKVPAFASAGLIVGAEPESSARALPTELNLMSSPSPEYLIPPKRYSVSLAYKAGLSAVVSDVLRGDVGARLKLKFVFFSKSWRKRLFVFTGLPSQEFSLVSLEGTTELAAADDHGWGKVAMPSPFPAILGPVPGSTAPTTTQPALTGPVEEFFYDSLCTCITANEDQKTGLPRDCVRNDDCCSTTPRCFSDPALVPAGRNSCVGSCRARGQSCNVPGDCCTAGDKCFNDPTDFFNYGSCTSCRGTNATCNTDTDCCNSGPTGTHTCINTPGLPNHGYCKAKSTCLLDCDSDADCATGQNLYCKLSINKCEKRSGTLCPPI